MLVEDIAKLLHNKDIGVYDKEGISGNIFINTMPPKPDDCIAIYQRGGLPSDAKLGYDNPTVQVMLRGTNPFTPSQLGGEIYSLLHGMGGEHIIEDGALVIYCHGLQSEVNYIGRDDNNRHEFSLNFQFEIVNKTKHRE